MPCMKPMVALLLVSLAAASSAALSFDPRLGPPSFGADTGLVLSTINDGLGMGPVGEWDDNDTAGFRADFRQRGLELILGYDVLTRRGSGPADASRVDALGAAFGLTRFYDLPGGLRLDLSGHLGLIAFGRFGGEGIQGGWHNGVAVSRPLPGNYEGGGSLGPVADARLGLLFARPLGPFLSLAGSLGPARGLSAAPMVGLVARRAAYRISLAAAYGLAWGGLPSALAESVAEGQEGPYLVADLTGGAVAVGLSWYPRSGTTSGSIGIRLGKEAGLTKQRMPEIALLYQPGLVATGYRLFIPCPLDGRLEWGPYAELGVGYGRKEISQEGLAHRTSRYEGGALLQLDLLRRRTSLSAAFSAGLALDTDTVQGAREAASSIEDRTTSLDLIAGPELKLGLSGRQEWAPFVGIGAGLLFRLGLGRLEGDAAFPFGRPARTEFRVFIFAGG